jgi:hypothetical protein
MIIDTLVSDDEEHRLQISFIRSPPEGFGRHHINLLPGAAVTLYQRPMSKKY